MGCKHVGLPEFSSVWLNTRCFLIADSSEACLLRLDIVWDIIRTLYIVKQLYKLMRIYIHTSNYICIYQTVSVSGNFKPLRQIFFTSKKLFLGWHRVCQAEARLAQGLYPQGGTRFLVGSKKLDICCLGIPTRNPNPKTTQNGQIIVVDGSEIRVQLTS